MAGHTRTGALQSSSRDEHQGHVPGGVFEPLEEVKGALPDQQYTAFADDELAKIRETLWSLKGAEKNFEFWRNATDAIYDET